MARQFADPDGFKNELAFYYDLPRLLPGDMLGSRVAGTNVRILTRSSRRELDDLEMEIARANEADMNGRVRWMFDRKGG